MLKFLPIFIIPILASCSTLQSTKVNEASEVITADLARLGADNFRKSAKAAE